MNWVVVLGDLLPSNIITELVNHLVTRGNLWPAAGLILSWIHLTHEILQICLVKKGVDFKVLLK